MQEIPEPNESGSAGTQESTRGEVIPLQAESPLAGLEVVKAVQGLASSSPGSIGGAAPAAFVLGIISQLSHDLGLTRGELAESNRQLDQTREQLSKERIRSEVLAERIRSHRRMRHLSNVTNVIGAILIGTAVQLYSVELHAYSAVAGFLGVALVVFAMIAASGEAKE